MSRLPYAYEKFMGAAQSLATSSQPLQKRLLYAAMSIHTLNPEDFPEGELRDLWNTISKSLTKEKPVGDEGSFEATTSKMPDARAEEVATLIWEMFSQLGDIPTQQMR